MTKLYFENVRPAKFYEGSTIVNGKTNVTYDKFHDVATVDICDVVDVINSNKIIIKMDIERAEYDVLGALINSSKCKRSKKCTWNIM